MSRTRLSGVRLAVVPAAVAATTLALVLASPGGVAGASNTAAPNTSSTNHGSARTLSLATSTARLPAGSTATPTANYTENTTAQAQLAALDGFGPAGRAAAMRVVNGVPVVAGTAVAASATGLKVSFQGINAYQNSVANQSTNFGPEPPDQALCAGNGLVLEGVNDSLRVFNTNGTPASNVVGLSDFYGYPPPINPKTGKRGPEVTDPTCIYDAGSNRFYFLSLTLAVDPTTGGLLGPNHLDLAVSRTGSPLGGWNIYRLPVQDDGTQGTQTHPGCPCIGDYPHIGSDKYGVYLTTNEFPLAGPGRFGGYNGSQVYALGKAALAAGSSTVHVVQFDSPIAGTGSNALPGFTVWPDQAVGTQYATGAKGTEYFLSSTAVWSANGTSTALQVWRLTDSQSLNTASPHPVLHGAIIGAEAYAVPPPTTQKVGPTPLADCLNVTCLPGQGPSSASEGSLDSNDTRVQQVYFSGGRLYTALDTAVQVAGSLKAGIAWFAINPGGSPSTATVSRQGYLAVAGQNVTYPALAVRPDGKGALAFTLSGASYFPSAAYSLFGGSGTGAVNVAGLGAAPEDGHCEYAFYNCAGNPTTPQARPRWGDYGAAEIVGSNVWIASEYIASRCTLAEFRSDPTCGMTRVIRANWSTHVAEVTP